jgi:hypothetical protein
MPLLDLHAHFPMHLDFPPRVTQGPPPVDKQAEFWAANMLLNFQGGKPRVSLDELLSGASGGIGSVLYDPDDEFFRDAKPVPHAFKDLLAQMNQAEDAGTAECYLRAERALLRRQPSECFCASCANRCG